MENDFVRRLRARLGTHAAVPLGIGDDAASVHTGEETLVTVDLLCEGTHFRLGEATPEQIGRKALAVSLSDIAAMAGVPLAVFVAFTAPADGGLSLVEGLYQGMIPLAEEFNTAIAGGDTNSWDGPLVISTTVLGKVHPRGKLTRHHARPGDVLLVTGSLGGSLAGHHLSFVPRVREAQRLHEGYELSAGMDLSDGLLVDLGRLIEASGVGAALDLEAIPISEAAWRHAGRHNRQGALEAALGDGEDFELLLCAAPGEAARMLSEQPLEIPLTQIGTIVAEPGLWLTAPEGRQRLEVRGWQHRLS